MERDREQRPAGTVRGIRRGAASDLARAFPRLLGNASRPAAGYLPFLARKLARNLGDKSRERGLRLGSLAETALIAPNLPAGFHRIYSRPSAHQK